MFTRILHNSERLCTFFDQLELQLYRPQRQHILNMADALLVCEDDKTLAALQRQFVDAPDASNMADCLRISPWEADYVRTTLRAEQRLAFRSKNALARQILEALRPLLPTGWTVYVQFDSWYASAKLINYVRRQRWHVTCGLKCNRTLNGVRIDHLASALRHRRYTRVPVTATDGNTTTYYGRQTIGRLSDVPHDVRVLFSKRHPRGKSSAYFLSTDLTRSAHQALQGYGGRWSCEVDNFYLKTRLGLADFRVRSYEAVDKYMVVVQLAWGYIERRFIQERAAKVKGYGDIIRRHQEEHAREWLTGALQMVLEAGAIEPVLQRFLRETD